MDKTEFTQKLGISFSDISDADFQLVTRLYAWGMTYDNTKDSKLRIALLWKLGGIELIKELLSKFELNSYGQCNTQTIFYNHNREMVELKIDELIEIEKVKQKLIRKQQKAEKQFLNDAIFNRPKTDNICQDPKEVEEWAQRKLIRF